MHVALRLSLEEGQISTGSLLVAKSDVCALYRGARCSSLGAEDAQMLDADKLERGVR
jgi:hypothetical protein